MMTKHDARHHVEISHNPFTVQTDFLINGQPPAAACKLSSYRELRLQRWVETLFDELSELFNGDNRFVVTFNGVESDCLDVVEAAEIAKAKGMQITLAWNASATSEERLKQIEDLIAELLAHPKLSEIVDQHEEIRSLLGAARSPDFHVYVAATMSSGKSTLINAMLGCDLLPARNEATTATIAQITDNKKLNGTFTARRLDKNDQELDCTDNVDPTTLNDWNSHSDTSVIEIEGNIVAMQPREGVRLVLTDTPGPNNSQDPEHERTTMSHIQDSVDNPLILYVLNAQQLGVNDDSRLLKLVAESMQKNGKQSKDRFIFVVNKMDVFDPEKGEGPDTALKNVRAYLEKNGISNPLIFPVSANLTRLLRKPADMHTRTERGDLFKMADCFEHEPSLNMVQYMPLSERVKRALENKGYSDLMLRSGLPAVEALIDEYIDKYNLPARVKRAYDALSKAIDIAKTEAHVVEGLQANEQALAQLSEELERLQQKKNKGFDALAYKDKVDRERLDLPEETVRELIRLDQENQTLVQSVRRSFVGQGDENLEEAMAIVERAKEDLMFHFKKQINAYESAFSDVKRGVCEELRSAYNEYIRSLFSECRQIELPVLEGIERAISNISLDLTVQQAHVQTKQVKTGSYKVSTSKWYKPWTWGDEETRHTYEDRQMVNLTDYWEAHERPLRGEFKRLNDQAISEMLSAKDTLVSRFKQFMQVDFEPKFNELLTSIQVALADKTDREEKIAEAKAMLEWIAGYNAQLAHTTEI